MEDTFATTNKRFVAISRKQFNFNCRIAQQFEKLDDYLAPKSENSRVRRVEILSSEYCLVELYDWESASILSELLGCPVQKWNWLPALFDKKYWENLIINYIPSQNIKQIGNTYDSPPHFNTDDLEQLQFITFIEIASYISSTDHLISLTKCSLPSTNFDIDTYFRLTAQYHPNSSLNLDQNSMNQITFPTMSNGSNNKENNHIPNLYQLCILKVSEIISDHINPLQLPEELLLNIKQYLVKNNLVTYNALHSCLTPFTKEFQYNLETIYDPWFKPYYSIYTNLITLQIHTINCSLLASVCDLIEKSPNLITLTLSFDSNIIIHNELWSKISNCVKLQNLELHDAKEIIEIQSIISQLTELSKLNISGSNLIDVTVHSSSLTSLTWLAMHGGHIFDIDCCNLKELTLIGWCDIITDTLLYKTLKTMPHLNLLNISECIYINFNSTIQNILQICTELKVLDLSDTQIPSSQLMEIIQQYAPQLTTLDCTINNTKQCFNFTKIEFSKLQVLKISYNGTLYKDEYSVYNGIYVNCPNLTQLEIQFKYRSEIEVLYSFLKGVPQLTHLQIHGDIICDNVKIDFLLPKLEYIKIETNDTQIDNLIERLMEISPNIKSMKIQYGTYDESGINNKKEETEMSTDEICEVNNNMSSKIEKHCSNIQHIQINPMIYEQRVEYAIIIDSLLYYSTSLKKLEINQVEAISHHFKIKSTTLTDLSLSDSDFYQFSIINCTSLKRITISSCYFESMSLDDLILLISKNSPSLEIMDITTTHFKGVDSFNFTPLYYLSNLRLQIPCCDELQLFTVLTSCPSLVKLIIITYHIPSNSTAENTVVNPPQVNCRNLQECYLFGVKINQSLITSLLNNNLQLRTLHLQYVSYSFPLQVNSSSLLDFSWLHSNCEHLIFNCPKAVTIDFSYSNVSLITIESINKFCKSLKKLLLQHSIIIFPNSSINNNSIEYINMMYASIPNPTIQCSNLLYLHLENSPFVDNNTLQKVLSLNTNIKRINLSGCNNLTQFICPVPLPKLEDINLSNSPIALVTIPNYFCPSLYCILVNSPDLICFTIINPISIVDLNYCTNLKNIQLECSNLKKLYINECNSISNWKIKLQNDLEQVNLEKSSIPDFILNEWFFDTSCKLTTLVLCKCDYLNNLTFKSNIISTIYILDCRNVTLLSINSTSLKTLYLENCSNIHKLTLICPILSRYVMLGNFSLQEYTLLSNELPYCSIDNIFAFPCEISITVPNIKFIEFHHTNNLPDYLLSSYCLFTNVEFLTFNDIKLRTINLENLRKLKCLQLLDCNNIIELEIINCPSLVSVSITNCWLLNSFTTTTTQLHLTSASFINCQLSLICFTEFLLKTPSLQALRLHNIPTLSDKFMTLLKNLTNLLLLECKDCLITHCNLSQNNVRLVTITGSLTKQVNLNCSSLTQLKLNGSCVSNVDIYNILQSHNLRYLWLNHCVITRQSDKIIDWDINSSLLVLECCESTIDNDLFHSILDKLKLLQHLNLSKSSLNKINIKSDSLLTLDLSSCHRLKSVQINSRSLLNISMLQCSLCENVYINAIGLQKICLSYCVKLTELNLICDSLHQFYLNFVNIDEEVILKWLIHPQLEIKHVYLSNLLSNFGKELPFVIHYE